MSEAILNTDVYAEILKDADLSSTPAMTRYAAKAMVELVKAEKADFLLLRDDKFRSWWIKTYKAAEKRIEQRNEKIREYQVKKNVWDRLTEEDRKILRLTNPGKEPTF